MKVNKKLVPFFTLLAISLMVFTLYSFKSIHGTADAYTSQPRWKNLKVLPQDISKDSLDFLMKNYATSLGVNCAHCHAPSATDPSKLDFANDDKIEKEIARGMIMMTNDLNANYFQPHFPDPKPSQVHVINCVMCHRGTTNPEKYLSQMGNMYKSYDPNRDNRKEKILENTGGNWKQE